MLDAHGVCVSYKTIKRTMNRFEVATAMSLLVVRKRLVHVSYKTIKRTICINEAVISYNICKLDFHSWRKFLMTWYNHSRLQKVSKTIEICKCEHIVKRFK